MNKNICICGHKKAKHDFAIEEWDSVGHHCLGNKDKCKCKKFTIQINNESKKK